MPNSVTITTTEPSEVNPNTVNQNTTHTNNNTNTNNRPDKNRHVADLDIIDDDQPFLSPSLEPQFSTTPDENTTFIPSSPSMFGQNSPSVLLNLIACRCLGHLDEIKNNKIKTNKQTILKPPTRALHLIFNFLEYFEILRLS